MLAEGGYWEEEPALEHVRLILNHYLGEPPATVEFEDEDYTPKEFLQSVLKLNLDDYRVAMSTLSYPFYEKARLDVPDNWWKSEEFYNLPLDDWYQVLLQAIPAGFSVGICGDTTEPGYLGEQDIALVPDFDIPPEAIDADARELRIFNGATTDDHCIHIVGHTRIGDHDWFLVKDSSRNPHPGKFWGYIFYRDDYVRLKMLTFIAHKDAFAPVADKLK
jgi:bleomycin hydrolase